ncbi:twin-arginine translocase subunit TatC [Flavilitoribacter nigricans]|uniref:Sec-independent protein translocase protein TatC n=1 Tax=Flavilitoribacter nigricans (strain ATCC 23147 / DSM 23189 / NBRC 102662 / NCIMB 1420 / SS-2) TaxID=1122177 RepID=A0A2D0NBR1_FLAN2|nr:twin-arginine translocase subunit TatC [Flavilitoribacter nigricans]PHN05800.1 twin-arginine translocase subunit TatC [Flavilitoribacter nigricans DSM 23189 = NBRC 102662]
MPLDQIDVDQIENGKSNPEEAEMSFLDHLEELRWHIIRSLIAILAVSIVFFIFKNWFFGTVLLGPTEDDFISYQYFCWLSEWLHAGSALCFDPPEFRIQATGFAENFILHIKSAFIGGFVAAFPYVFYEIWKFVVPGLYPNERKVTRGVVIICSFLFITGVLFGYFVIAPFAINFLGGYVLPGVENAPTVSSLIGYMVMFTLPAGLIFELPMVVYFLSKLGLVTPAGMKQYRRHAVIGILALSAIITPPDVVTQFLIGIPLFILYELSIGIARRGEKEYNKDLE